MLFADPDRRSAADRAPGEWLVGQPGLDHSGPAVAAAATADQSQNAVVQLEDEQVAADEGGPARLRPGAPGAR
jgi:sarcosine oxidase gamma subunit